MPGLNDDSVEMQEIHCHNCDRYVQFPLDLSLNGNHVLHCPNCNHEHCRVVRNGKISDVRWDQRNNNLQTYYVPYQTITMTTMSAVSSSSNTVYFFGSGTCTTVGSW